jgi:catechol 2,3-dioxygenase-like lactoylglutathione lyase family enzyme
MDQILALRPFVPAKDYELSRRFYAALNFRATHSDDQVTILKLGAFSFILQNYYVPELADNMMVQILVRDVNAWWRELDAEGLVREFAVKPPRPPALQSWGMKVGFIFDPSGVLWHIAEVPF